jgi:hypothetical protein
VLLPVASDIAPLRDPHIGLLRDYKGAASVSEPAGFLFHSFERVGAGLWTVDCRLWTVDCGL